MNSSGICIIFGVWVVGVSLRSVVVWVVEDQPKVEAAYIGNDVRGCVEMLSDMWGEVEVCMGSATPLSCCSVEKRVVGVYGWFDCA